jgi:hypothetical protein
VCQQQGTMLNNRRGGNLKVLKVGQIYFRTYFSNGKKNVRVVLQRTK